MAKYNVCFTQNWNYSVEAEDEDKAFEEAYKEFKAEMRSSVACTSYDDCEIKCLEENEDE